MSDACEGAVKNINDCVANLSSCEQVEAWWDHTPFDSYPCEAADDERDSVCYWPPNANAEATKKPAGGTMCDVGAFEAQP